MAAKPAGIDEYIAAFPQGTQKILKQIRATIKKLVPDAAEKISYGIPTFTLGEKYFIYFAGFKNHISLYPVPNKKEFEKDFSSYKTSGKGTIQFPLDKPIPFELVEKIVKYLADENFKKPKKSPAKKYVKYHNDGSIWAKGKMINDTPEGYWEWFRKDGVIMRSGYFANGKQVREWTTYDKKGQVYKVTRMKDQ